MIHGLVEYVMQLEDMYISIIILIFYIAFYEKIRLREKFAEELLIGYKDDIDEHNKVILETFKNYPYSYKSKLKLLTSKNIQTPYMFTNIKIKLAILINKF